MALTVPDPDFTRALAEDAHRERPMNWWQRVRRRRWTQARPLPGASHRWASWFFRLTRPLPAHWRHVLFGPPPPPARELPGQIIWHKHWINLCQRAGIPLLAVAGVLVLGFLLAFVIPDSPVLSGSALLLAWLALLLFPAAWLWWEVVDYWNDIYVVTDDKIIDIERAPLGLSSKRREGSLDRVQTVDARQVGLLPNLLNYGDVIIQTAAANEGFTFEVVGSPKLVQRVIFQKLDGMRRQQEERHIEERQRVLREGLEVYHELQQDRNVG